MNSSNYRFTLDMQSNISQVSLPVRKGDTSRKLYINLTDSGIPYFIEDGCRAVFSARKADDNAILNDCVIEKNTTIRYDFSPQTTSSPGVVDCEIRLYGTEGNLITSPRFILVVDERVVYDSDFPLSESDKSAIDSIILSETARVEAEEDRKLAESERARSEAARAEAEQTRQTEFEAAEAAREERANKVVSDANASVESLVSGTSERVDALVLEGQEAVNDAREAASVANTAAEGVVSPAISVTSISGGHRVTIVDKNGTKTFDVMNGEGGSDLPDITEEDEGNILQVVDGAWASVKIPFAEGEGF